MTKALKIIAIFQGVIPFAATGILLLAGAGIFAFGAGYLLMAIGERFVKSRKQQAAPIFQQGSGLSLVEMDVQMKYRDKSVDLRVIN